MSIRVAAYTAGGMASGVMARPGHLREALESGEPLVLERASWRAIGAPADKAVGERTLATDDILLAIADEDLTVAVHASWHAIRLVAGPFVIEGELPTLPGYDPGRALARPSGEFVELRDVRLGLAAIDAAPMPLARHALVNRYGVERVRADIMLGFFFPGAVLEGVEPVSA